MNRYDELKKYIEENAKLAYDLNYAVAADPELSGCEYRACARYVELCRQMGWPVEENFTKQKTAFRAVVTRPEKAVLKVALLAEYDALPDIGHGCGHSANGAMSFLAAAALSKVKDLPVQIDLIGTPDEELRGGKAVMVREGVFKDYDLALMIHISSDRTEPNSEVLALSCYRVVFHGQTAHGAHDPWKGRNALNGAMLALHAVDMLRQHVRPETRIGTYIVDGGTASNVVPDRAELECTLRYTSRPYLNEVVEKFMNCIKGAALATETTYEVTPIEYMMPDGSNGSSDVGNVSHQCPALQLYLAAGDTYYPGHSREIAAMVQDKKIEPVLSCGAEIMGRIILKLATDEKSRRAVADEFARTQESRI